MSKMKKKNIYRPESEIQQSHTLREPEVTYLHRGHSEEAEGTYPVMSLKEALTNGMPLEESRRLMFERIQKDFQ